MNIYNMYIPNTKLHTDRHTHTYTARDAIMIHVSIIMHDDVIQSIKNDTVNIMVT